MVFLRPLPHLLHHHRAINHQPFSWVSLKSFPSAKSPIKIPFLAPKSTLSSLFPSPPQPPVEPKRTHEKRSNLKANDEKTRRRKKGEVKKVGSFGPAYVPPVVEVSPGMAALIGRLHQDGFLKEESFWKEGGFDPCRLNVYEHSVGFLKFAVEQFGQKHQEIAKWLSGKHIKEVALLGCPSTDRKTVYAAKSLRSFFSIQEDTVCRACKLRAFCKFPNKRAGREEKLILVDVLFVLIGYAFPNPPSQHHMLLDEIKFSIDKILKDVVNLSS